MLRHPEDRLPLLLILCLFALDLAVWWLVRSPWLVAAWTLASLLPKAGVCAFNHHHQHLTTFKYEWLNRLIEIPYALQTGISSHAWVLHHSVGHHLNYLDQTKDESRWARDDGSKMGEAEYSIITFLTAYPRAWQVSARYPKFRRIFAVMGLLTLCLVIALVAYRPIPGLIIFVLAPLVSLFGTAWATYAHHAGLPTSSHFVACFNILQPFYNVLTGNLGYHTAHHFKPGVHWSKLPELHAEIAPLIPLEDYVAPGWPWYLMGPSPMPAAPPAEPEPGLLVTAVASGDER